MAISLGILTQHFQLPSHMTIHGSWIQLTLLLLTWLPCDLFGPIFFRYGGFHKCRYPNSWMILVMEKYGKSENLTKNWWWNLHILKLCSLKRHLHNRNDRGLYCGLDTPKMELALPCCSLTTMIYAGYITYVIYVTEYIYIVYYITCVYIVSVIFHKTLHNLYETDAFRLASTVRPQLQAAVPHILTTGKLVSAAHAASAAVLCWCTYWNLQKPTINRWYKPFPHGWFSIVLPTLAIWSDM